MRTRAYDFDGLLELPALRDLGARRAAFRSALASLARATTDLEGPSPLDGVAPDALVRAIRSALDAALLDDLGWLSPAAAGVALFEIGAALPAGSEQREVGRRVIARLHEGTADVFAAIATRMALSSRKGLQGSAIRARVSLLFATRGGAVDGGPLAFALVSRRELAREWVAQASTGSLPSRRLAARILERAAVLAARRAAQGDDYAPRVFATQAVSGAFARLLADREPLVWRHAAVARGLLAGVVGTQWKSTIESLHPRLTPTEWRRGAVSLVAAIATSPERAAERARELVSSQLAVQDRGLVATMVWGLPRVFEAEPEIGESLLDAIVDADGAGAAEGIAAVVREVGGDVGRRAIATARALLVDRAAARSGDEAELLVARALADELDPDRGGESSVRSAVGKALHAWVDRGAREAQQLAASALEAAQVAMSTLEGLGADEAGLARRTSVLLLRDLDAALLEESTLSDLLQLGRRSDDPLDDLHERIGRWGLAHERVRPTDAAAIAASGRRLRVLLHLVDAESRVDDDDAARATRIRQRRAQVVSMLLSRLARDGRSALHRTTCATLARALDALVRDGACEPVDVMLVSASRLDDPTDVATLADASMDPDVAGTLAAWARFAQSISAEEPLALVSSRPRPADRALPTIPPVAVAESIANPIEAKVEAILELAAALAEDGSGRAEGVRALLVRTSRALQTFGRASCRRELAGAGGSAVFEALADAMYAYAQIEQGATRRLALQESEGAPSSSAPTFPATGRLAARLAQLVEPSPIVVRESLGDVMAEARRLLPAALVRAIGDVVGAFAEKPYELETRSASQAPSVRVSVDVLPSWLGARRTLGGFYIVRPLGGGATSSVFVAKRIEERHDADAELFALKVPDYDGAAARSLSEQEFLDYFRAEASALLNLPPVPNLARFVTFDLAARPKPILVMELIEGPTLERFVGGADGAKRSDEGGRPRVGRAIEILDGVLAGLDVMHGHAIGHLDLKPSNVILRSGGTPTLVDFGLAGRHIRPGCATGPYGAPEVWGVLPDDFSGTPSPLPADVYAFGALAFEVLTGETLFDASNEVAVIGQHLAHDGHPSRLDGLARVRPLMEIVEHTLRRDPRARWTVPQLRHALRVVAPAVKDLAWPIA